MQLMAMWRCRHLIADIVAGLPIHQYRTEGNTRRPVPLSPFVASPSNLVEPEEWRYQMALEAAGHGNGIALVTKFSSTGWPEKAETVAWQDVQVRQPGGAFAAPVYKIAGEVIDPERVLHMRAFGPRAGSVFGMSPIAYAAQTIGLGLAVRDFGANWYESGGHPTTLLSTDADIDDIEALRAKEKFRQATRDDHIAVMGNAWDLKSVQVAPDDALFLAATNATAIDICGYYGIPGELLGYATAGSSVTYANREQRAIDLLVFTIQWWIGRMEKLISRQLPRQQFVKIEVDALLRSDAETRWKIHDLAVKLGARNIDRVRELEDEPPLPDGAGQVYLLPSNAAQPVVAARSEAPTFNVGIDARQEPPVVNVENRVDARQEPPVVNVENRVDARQEAPVVNAHVDARQAPPVVNVENRIEPAVPPPAEQRSVRKTIEHTADGRIAAIIEEPA